MTRPSVFIIFFLILASTFAVHGTAGSPEIAVSTSGDSVRIVMSLDLLENFTSLPLFVVHLGASNSTLSGVSGPMAAAMQKLVPSARIDSLQLDAKTSLVDSRTGTWMLQENYVVKVSGVNNRVGSTITSNMAFLQMNVSAPISIQGVELNNVGSAYLIPPLQSLRAQQLAQNVQDTRYFFDHVPYFNTVVPGNGTLTFNLLDFTWVLPLAGWGHHYDPFASTSTWSLPSYVVTPYNLTVGYRLLESQYIPSYEAVYSPSVEISAPPRASAMGNEIVFVEPSVADVIMPLIIAASLVIVVVAFVVDRRITRRLRVGKKKR